MMGYYYDAYLRFAYWQATLGQAFLSTILHLTSHDDEDGDNGSGDEEDYDNYDLVE